MDLEEIVEETEKPIDAFITNFKGNCEWFSILLFFKIYIIKNVIDNSF